MHKVERRIVKTNAMVPSFNLCLKCKKSTPLQITLYQSSLKLHKTVNENLEDLTFEQITVLNQMICTSRQVNFQVCRSNCFKIGMNTTANKFYALNNQIGLSMLNLSFVHFKKLAKIQFLKYGKTWRGNPKWTPLVINVPYTVIHYYNWNIMYLNNGCGYKNWCPILDAKLMGLQ